MLDCNEKEQLMLYLYGELDDVERIAFEKHLANCESCVRELEEHGLVRSIVLEHKPTGDISEKTVEEIKEQARKELKVVVIPQRKSALRFISWIAAAAACVAVIILSSKLLPPNRPAVQNELAWNSQVNTEVTGIEQQVDKIDHRMTAAMHAIKRGKDPISRTLAEIKQKLDAKEAGSFYAALKPKYSNPGAMRTGEIERDLESLETRVAMAW